MSEQSTINWNDIRDSLTNNKDTDIQSIKEYFIQGSNERDLIELFKLSIEFPDFSSEAAYLIHNFALGCLDYEEQIQASFASLRRLPIDSYARDMADVDISIAFAAIYLDHPIWDSKDSKARNEFVRSEISKIVGETNRFEEALKDYPIVTVES